MYRTGFPSSLAQVGRGLSLKNEGSFEQKFLAKTGSRLNFDFSFFFLICRDHDSAASLCWAGVLGIFVIHMDMK